MKAIVMGAALAALLAPACGSSSPATPVDDGGPQLTDGGCYSHPQTHAQIINACTDAGSIDKSPVLPLLQPDGGLPPLP